MSAPGLTRLDRVRNCVLSMRQRVCLTDMNIILNLVSADGRSGRVVIAAVGRRCAVECGPLLGRTGRLRRFARRATARAGAPLLVLRAATALLRTLAVLLARLAALATASDQRTTTHTQRKGDEQTRRLSAAVVQPSMRAAIRLLCSSSHLSDSESLDSDDEDEDELLLERLRLRLRLRRDRFFFPVLLLL